MVHSEKAHALIKSVDASAALEHHGVVAYFGANDVPYNQIGPVIKDEELFASNEVLCIGYPIGIVVAKTQREAQQAARLVKVKYEELDSVLTIQEAIEKNAFFAEKHHITRGDVDKGFESCDHIIEGKFEMVRKNKYINISAMSIRKYQMLIYFRQLGWPRTLLSRDAGNARNSRRRR
jgi:xanthine dehydrogenase/oxidase